MHITVSFNTDSFLTDQGAQMVTVLIGTSNFGSSCSFFSSDFLGRPVLHFYYPCIFCELRTPVTDNHRHPALLIPFRILLHRPLSSITAPFFINRILVTRGRICNNAVNANFVAPPPA